jgi:hypothetical protein
MRGASFSPETPDGRYRVSTNRLPGAHWHNPAPSGSVNWSSTLDVLTDPPLTDIVVLQTWPFKSACCAETDPVGGAAVVKLMVPDAPLDAIHVPVTLEPFCESVAETASAIAAPPAL